MGQDCTSTTDAVLLGVRRASENGATPVEPARVPRRSGDDRMHDNNANPEKRIGDDQTRRFPADCPACGQPVAGIETRGPADQRARPCGHSIRSMSSEPDQHNASPATVPERIRATILESRYPELSLSEVANQTDLTTQQVRSAAGSIPGVEWDRRLDILRLAEDDGGDFLDERFRADGGAWKAHEPAADSDLYGRGDTPPAAVRNFAAALCQRDPAEVPADD